MQQTSEPQARALRDVEILIVGFGFSSIPLIRELQEEGRKFVVVSDGHSVWERLEAAERLDFDLVSSAHSSLFSFELVRRGEAKDSYPTAREFLDHHKKWQREFRPEELVVDRVTEIDNYPRHSIVRTRSGLVLRAKQVVIATACWHSAFRRGLQRVRRQRLEHRSTLAGCEQWRWHGRVGAELALGAEGWGIRRPHGNGPGPRPNTRQR